MELPNIIRLDNFYTQKQYTKACGVSVNTTRNRIKSGLIATLKIDGQLLINTGGYPLNTRYKPNVEYKPTFTFPATINKDDLVHVLSYSQKNHKAPYKFFQAILAGNIFGLILGGELFAYKHELGAI